MLTTPAIEPPNALQLTALSNLMGLAIFGERVAARTYVYMGECAPEHDETMRKFAMMEGKHAAWFLEASRKNGVEPNREFAERELGYLLDQVDRYRAERDFEALEIVQGFIVESLAIATYEPFLEIADKFPGTRAAFEQALADEHYHVAWVTDELKRRYADRQEEFVAKAEAVNVQGVDCIGGTMMNISGYLDTIGMSGGDCAGRMMDAYTEMLENVGIPANRAIRNVISLFMPLVRKYRHGERTK